MGATIKQPQLTLTKQRLDQLVKSFVRMKRSRQEYGLRAVSRQIHIKQHREEI